MGTSGAYGGSGGRAWGKVRTDAGDYAAAPTDANAQVLLADIAKALDWDADQAKPDARPDADSAPPPFNQLLPIVARPRIPPRSGAGGGAGGGASGGAGGGTGRGGGGGRRSRARAAAVGGSVAAAGLAYRNRDEQTLAEFGLSLAVLDGLDAFDQARFILDVVAGSVGAITEDELQHASGVAVLALLDPANSPADAIREFVTDYVFEVAITEVGEQLRQGARDGHTTVAQEDRLRSIIRSCVGQVDLPAQVTTSNIQQAIYYALGDARTYFHGSS
jgi:hypothetical protein